MRCLILCLLLALTPALAGADTGVLMPYRGGRALEADAISLDQMEIRLHIDHGTAQIEILQIHANHVAATIEGRFRMIIPEAADISAFAVWDDLVRIPGVIVERQKAKQLFEQLERASIDPGLLESADEPSVLNEFTARIFPIPPYGTKRLEMTYRMPVPIERGQLDFVLPLKPNEGGVQKVGRLIIDIEVDTGLPVENIAFHGASLTPTINEETDTGFTARFEAENIVIDEDLAFTVAQTLPDTTLDLIAYRDVEHVDWSISPDGGGHFTDEYGYFLARALFAPRESSAVGNRNIVLVVDGSISMLGDKLDRTVEMIHELAAHFAPTDKVTLLYANLDAQVVPGGAQPINASRLAQLEAWLRKQELAGGLDLAAALNAAGENFDPGAANVVVLLSDGHPTAGELRPLKIVERVKQSRLVTDRGRLFAVGIGNDANKTLMTDLAAVADGHYTWCADTADTVRLAETVAARMAASVMRQIELTFSEPGRIVDAYPPTVPSTFAGSEALVVGRYSEPGPMQIKLRYRPDEEPVQTRSFAVDLPVKNTDHESIRRIWAKARVDFLLDRIRREGETKEWINEIIALSKRFTFVTPYTSFLAAPRALLRPRVIRPGDPLLRVRTDRDIRAVTAVFGWGLTAPLTYLEDEDVWQVRFLAPPHVPDGEHECKLLLVDRDNRQFVVPKTFLLDGAAPTVKLASMPSLQAGSRARLVVYADADTRRLYARLPSTGSATLRWDNEAKANVGTLEVPAGVPPGPTQLEIYAEDFAHNVSRTLIDVEVSHAE